MSNVRPLRLINNYYSSKGEFSPVELVLALSNNLPIVIIEIKWIRKNL